MRSGPRSLLLCRGVLAVHGLFTWLLNTNRSFDRAVKAAATGRDVPTLLSPVPFEHAQMSAPRVEFNGPIKAAEYTRGPRGAHSGLRSARTEQYCLELSGWLMPTAVRGLCRLCR